MSRTSRAKSSLPPGVGTAHTSSSRKSQVSSWIRHGREACAALGSLIAGFGRRCDWVDGDSRASERKSQPKDHQNGKQAEAYHIFGMTAQVPIHHMVGGVEARPDQKASQKHRRGIDSDQYQQGGDADPGLEGANIVDQVLVAGRKQDQRDA
jgi:hypothetical protein